MFIDMETSYKTTVKTIDDDDDSDDGDNTYGRSDTSSVVSFGRNKSIDADDREKDDFEETPASMADDRWNKSLCDLPYGVTRDLMRSMDTNRGWEAVAAEADYAFDSIQLLAMKEHQADGSPTRTLLWELGCLSYKVSDLYEKLRAANRLREMQILENYANAAGKDKGAVGGKKFDSPKLVSLPSLLSQLKVPGKENQPQRHPESGFSSAGSEINFNHLSPQNKSKPQVGGAKNYDDKVIPGTDKPYPFGASNQQLFGGACKVNDSFNRSMSASVASHYINRAQAAESSEGHGPKSLPSSFSPSSTSSQGRSNYSPNCGADNITRMLGNVLPSSAHSSLPHSIGKSSFQSHPPSMSQKSSMGIPETGGAVSRQGNISSAGTLDTGSDMEVAMSVKTVFSYNELFKATAGLSDINLLGEGAFGKVYKGNLRHLDCAIKILNMGTSDSADKSAQVKNELTTLLRYQHENIVTLYGYALDGPALCLVYQYLENGSLEDRLLQKNNTPPLGWERRINILVGACKGLNFLHTMGDKPLIHGDIKSANILLDQYMEAKLGDLGQATYATSPSKDTGGFTHITIAEKATKQFGTKAFQPPEVMKGGALSTKSDIYAMGVVFLEVCSGQQAYDQDRISGQFLADFFRDNVLNKPESEWAAEFRDRTMNNAPEDRFIEVLKLADRCTREVKKQRPDSVKLLNEVKNIYKKYREQIGDDGDFSSISSSLQIDSQGSEKSVYQSLRGSERSCYQSHGSEGVLPGELTGAASLPYRSVQQQRIQQLQQQRLEQFHSLRPVNHQPQSQPSPQQLHRVVDSSGDGSTPQASEAVEMRRCQANDPESPVWSLRPNQPLPEALRLQRAYDNQREKKKIERLSEVVTPGEEVLEEEYPSDPEKLKKIDTFDQGEQNYEQQHPVSQAVDQREESFPKSDPKKLAQLFGYDEGYLDTQSDNNSTIITYECDPKKMAYLQNFDDNLYQNPKQSLQKNCTPSDTSLSETAEKTKDEMVSGHLPSAQTLIKEVAYFPGSSNPVNIPVSGASQAVHNTDQQQFEKDNVLYGGQFRYRWSSDDNNVSDQTEDVSVDTSLGDVQVDRGCGEKSSAQQKMFDLFSRYQAMKETCGSEEETEADGEKDN